MRQVNKPIYMHFIMIVQGDKLQWLVSADVNKYPFLNTTIPIKCAEEDIHLQSAKLQLSQNNLALANQSHELFTSLFSSELQLLFMKESEGTLQFTVPKEFADIPFEALCVNPANREFLGNRYRMATTILHQRNKHPKIRDGNDRLTAFFGDMDSLDDGLGEYRKVQKAFKKPISRSDQRGANAFFAAFQGASQFHFMGHSEFGEGKSQLLLHDGESISLAEMAQWADQLTTVPTLFFANSCQSACADKNSLGIAGTIHTQGIPYTIGSSVMVRNHDSVLFSELFYGALRENSGDYGEALRIARSEFLKLHPDAVIPFLYRLFGTVREADSSLPTYIDAEHFTRMEHQNKRKKIAIVVMSFVTLFLLFIIIVLFDLVAHPGPQ